MKGKITANLIGLFNMILAAGAIFSGFMMLLGSEIFYSYPSDWLDKMPVTSWVFIGFVVILIFGIGNGFAAVYSFKKHENKSYIFTIMMGLLLLISLALQVFILKEWYLATIELLILSTIQIALGLFGYFF